MSLLGNLTDLLGELPDDGRPTGPSPSDDPPWSCDDEAGEPEGGARPDAVQCRPTLSS